MNTKPTVSIAMATFNGERYLLDQLTSFVHQEELPDELVVSDDASTDATAAIVHAFARTAPFAVRLDINKERLGVGGNFGKAMAACSGDIVLISDQDDVWLPGKVSHVRRFFGSEVHARTLLLATDAVIVDSELRPLAPSLMHEAVRLRGSPRDFVAGSCTAIRRELLGLAEPFPVGSGAMGYDEWLHLVAAFLGSRVVQENAFQYYRRHAANASQSVAYQPRRSAVKALRHRLALLRGALASTTRSRWLEQQFECARHVWHRIETSQQAATFANTDQLAQLEGILQTLEARRALRNRPRVARIPSIARLYLGGRYEAFSGWKSMISDAL